MALIASWTMRHPFASFVILAYGISWAFWAIAAAGGGDVPFLLGVFGPAVAAGIAVHLRGESLADWLRPVWHPPCVAAVVALRTRPSSRVVRTGQYAAPAAGRAGRLGSGSRPVASVRRDVLVRAGTRWSDGRARLAWLWAADAEAAGSDRAGDVAPGSPPRSRRTEGRQWRRTRRRSRASAPTVGSLSLRRVRGHQARAVGEDDLCVGMSLQVEPPGRLARRPTHSWRAR